ncbi:protein FAM174C [Etheostoma cragini]|uniref:protein FAM174C n=1 Tax=Etheostoma cragini TaxID=417921 RepID=UPI00155EFCFC|nr:protein FAM174C [Etheostoma cragini]
MTFHRVLSAVCVPICWACVSAAEGTRTASTGGATAAPGPAGTNSSSGANSTHSAGGGGRMLNGLNVDSSVIQRALYVLIGITMIGVLYFLIRAVRMKRPASKKKYGLLANSEDGVEMEGGDSDEDDTLYEARSLRR